MNMRSDVPVNVCIAIFKNINRLPGIRSILHINEKAGQFGGTEEYIASLAALLSPMSIRSHLLYGHLHGNMPSCMESHVKISGLGNREGDKDAALKVLHTVSKISPDIVYVHNIFDSQVFRLLDTPERKYVILWYIHDHYPTCLTELRALKGRENIVCHAPLSKTCLSNIDLGRCVQRYTDISYSGDDLSNRLALLESTKHVDAIVVVSNFMKDILVKNIPGIESKVYVLPRQIRNNLRTIEQIKAAKEKEWVVVFSGRITYEKGLHIALEALGQLDMRENIMFKIAGPVENESYWSHCLKLARKAESYNPFLKICYVGHLNYNEVELLYTEADLVVVPSIWGEPLGVVAAEALINNAAVIALNVGGINTWIEHNETGFLIEPGNISAFSEGIKQLLSNKELRNKLTRSGKQLIASKFTGKEHIKALLKVICKDHS